MTTLRLTENPIELLPLSKKVPLITSHNKLMDISFTSALLAVMLSILLIIPLSKDLLSPLILLIPTAVIFTGTILGFYGLSKHNNLLNAELLKYSNWVNAQQDINVINIIAWAKSEANIDLSETAALILLKRRKAVTLLNGDEVILKNAVDDKDYLFKVLPLPVSIVI